VPWQSQPLYGQSVIHRPRGGGLRHRAPLCARPRFAFGTWKVEILGGFASAVLLMAVAGLMVWGSVERLLQPVPIAHREAMAIAALGLLVNAACALILMRAGGGHHHHGHHHGHHHADHHGPACAHDAAHGHEHGHAHAHANHGARRET